MDHVIVKLLTDFYFHQKRLKTIVIFITINMSFCPWHKCVIGIQCANLLRAAKSVVVPSIMTHIEIYVERILSLSF